MMLRSYYKKDYAPRDLNNLMNPILGYFHNFNVF